MTTKKKAGSNGKNPHAAGQLHTDGRVNDGRDLIGIRVTRSVTMKKHARVMVKAPEDGEDMAEWLKRIEEARTLGIAKLEGKAELRGISDEVVEDPPDVKWSTAVNK